MTKFANTGLRRVELVQRFQPRRWHGFCRVSAEVVLVFDDRTEVVAEKHTHVFAPRCKRAWTKLVRQWHAAELAGVAGL